MTNPKILVFDLDDTLYKNTWKVINPTMGVSEEENYELYQKRKSGELSQQEWLDSLFKIYSKTSTLLKKENFLNMVDKFTENTDVHSLISYLREKEIDMYLLSGGVDVVVEEISHRLGIKYLGASISSVIKNNSITGFTAHPDESEYKLERIESLQSELMCSNEDIACIGDGDNEKMIFDYTKRGITFTDSPLASTSWKVIASLDDLKNIF